MWTCNLCNQNFKHQQQLHYCGDKSIGDFLANKDEAIIALFNHFVASYRNIGPIELRPTQSMIALVADRRFAYIIKIGKNFIDVVFPFKELFEDNLCFKKIAPVPGSKDFNHHLRLCDLADINDEVLAYMKRAYANGKNS